MWNPLDGLSTVNVAFKLLGPQARMPVYSSAEAAGADLFATANVMLSPGDGRVHKIHTGVAIQLPPGFEAQVRPRSGLAAKHGITVANSPGTIDSDYRGEIVVLLQNQGKFSHWIQEGDRIAQLVVVPVFRAKFVEVNELGTSIRGTGGFGSTGT